MSLKIFGMTYQSPSWPTFEGFNHLLRKVPHMETHLNKHKRQATETMEDRKCNGGNH